MHGLLKLLWACALVGTATLAHAAYGSGTGFVITPQGHIATNYHVIDGAKRIAVKDSTDREFKARLVLADPNNDLAILQIDDTSHPVLPIRPSASMKKGAPVFTLGFPNIDTQGFESKVTEGIVSSLSGIQGRPNSFQISVPVQPGNSGGPLLDFTGSVVGLTTEKLPARYMLSVGSMLPENVNYAVKSNYLLELARTNDNIGSKVTLSTSEKTLPLPTLVTRVEKSVVLIFVELEERSAQSAEKPAAKPENREAEPKYVSDALAIKAYDLGLAAYKAEKYADALGYFGDAASRGHRQAQFYMGEIYYRGRGVSVSYREAFSWYRKSAEQGFSLAQSWVCTMYRNGRGVDKSEAEAAKWCESAAKAGEPWAQLEIGLMYGVGAGVPKDAAKSFEWVRKAADAGYKEADQPLGVLYYEGAGVAQNYTEAFIHLLRAAKRGQPLAQNLVGFMYYEGKGVAKDLDLSFRWFRDAALQGYATGQFNLGLAYEHGRGVAKDDTEALGWYRASAAQGNEPAKRALQTLEARLEQQKTNAARAAASNTVEAQAQAAPVPPKAAPSRVPVGDIVEVNLNYGYAVVKTPLSVAENTPLDMDVAGRKITAKAARQAGEKLSITMDRSELTAALMGVRVYQNK